MRERLRALFDIGVAAADPGVAVARALPDVPPAQIIAVGKAARAMAAAALARFPGVPAIVVTNYENAADLAGAQVFAAGHPVPDQNGFDAALAVIAALKNAQGPVLALISGGGSALLPAPVAGISLVDKARMSAVLLSSGLDIHDVNLVRQQLSLLKGGGFLRLAAPHLVTALILSDVVGDDLATIASGPTVAPIGTRAQAVALLQNFWSDVPLSVRAHLQGADTPNIARNGKNILIGSNTQSLATMQAAEPGAYMLPHPVEGDVAEAALLVCDAVRPGLNFWGGETVVTLRGTGKGGRNQELALRIAVEAKRRGWTGWTCLQGGTDGRDGPVDAAGGIVDHGTLGRIADAGGDVSALLGNNDSYAALSLSGDLLMTGATGTNVADLGVLWRSE